MTLEQLQNFLFNTPFVDKSLAYPLPDLVSALSAVEQKINNTRAFCMFLSQSAYETRKFTAFVENLYYTTASRIQAVWPSRFRDKDVSHLVRNPQGLANEVYANRGGNGSPESGDGFRFRGRGAFHLTFRNNYRACSLALYNDNRLETNPDLVANCDVGFLSALWFWNTNNITNLVNSNKLQQVTKVINGSTATYPSRAPYFTAACKVYGIE